MSSPWSIRFNETTWNHELAPIGDVKPIGGEQGPLAASWGMALPTGFLHPALVQGVTVEIFYVGLRVWRGVLKEPNRETWECTAVGMSEALTDVANLSVNEPPDLGNNIYDGAVRAIERGFDFTADPGLPGAPDGPSDPTPVTEYGLYLRAALDDYTTQTGQRWAVDEHGRLHLPVEPTTPTYALTPTVPGLGLTLEHYYSATYMRYWDGTFEAEDIKTIKTVYAVSEDAWRWGPRERTVEHDLDVAIGDGSAQAIVDAYQAEAVAAPTQGVTLSEGQLITLGGTRVPLQMLKTGTMLRHYGVLDVPGARNVHEWVVGHVEFDTAAGTAAVSPRYIAPRTFAQVSTNPRPNPRITTDSDAA